MAKLISKRIIITDKKFPLTPKESRLKKEEVIKANLKKLEEHWKGVQAKLIEGRKKTDIDKIYLDILTEINYKLLAYEMKGRLGETFKIELTINSET
jgi:hypothetical protein